jgi:hypothetical protein
MTIWADFYANLAGDMARQARAIIEAMHVVGLKRLIFISSMGIDGEVPERRIAASWTRIGTRRSRSRHRTSTTPSSARVGSSAARGTAARSPRRACPS